MNNVCQCAECKSGLYNPLDYVVKNEDLKILDMPRPLGISGHLRVKNEAMSVAQSIDSCIDALDELIITYNTSEDNTEEILKEYQKKYPDKIRLYHYKPNIINYTATEKELEEFKSKKMYYNTESVHSLANYYNFGCIKIKYKYYLKIDADQIYFKDKLLEVRKSLLYDLNNVNEIKEYKKIMNYVRYKLLMEKIAWLIPVMKLRYDFRLKYTSKIYKKIIEQLGLFNLIIFYRLANKDNCCYPIAGIQTVMHNNKICIPKNVNNSKLTTFNSCGNDHSIWVPYSKNKFVTHNSPIENIDCKIEGNECPLGFFWIHLAPIKRKINVNKNEIITDILDINSINSKYFFYPKIKFSEDLSIYWSKIFFDYDKKFLTKEFFDKYFDRILRYAINYYK